MQRKSRGERSFAFRMIGENHELLSCVFSKDNEGGKEE